MTAALHFGFNPKLGLSEEVTLMMVDLPLHPSSFACRGLPVYQPALFVKNKLNCFLFEMGSQSDSPLLITFNKPDPVFGSGDVNGIAMKDAPLDTWMARSESVLLNDIGIHVPKGSVNRMREALVVSNLLSGNVCVVKVKTQRGTEFARVTKSPEIISALRSSFALPYRKKGLDYFTSQLSTSYEELSSGSFNAVRLFWDIDGIHPSKFKIGQRSARNLIPYYSVQNYALHLVNILGQRKVTLVYRDDEGVHPPLLTTLSNEVVSSWLGTTLAGAAVVKRADWANPSSFGYLSLPNLAKRGHFVSVPVLGIEKVAF